MLSLETIVLDSYFVQWYRWLLCIRLIYTSVHLKNITLFRNWMKMRLCINLIKNSIIELFYNQKQTTVFLSFSKCSLQSTSFQIEEDVFKNSSKILYYRKISSSIFSETTLECKVNSVQEAYTKCFAVQILKF